MAIISGKIEFDLTIRKYGDKHNIYDYPTWKRGEEPKLEVIEELKFRSLSVVEVMRKLLDYIRDY